MTFQGFLKTSRRLHLCEFKGNSKDPGILLKSHYLAVRLAESVSKLFGKVLSAAKASLQRSRGYRSWRVLLRRDLVSSEGCH